MATWVEDDRGNILGFISVWTQDPLPFIHHLFVTSSHQRQGIVKRLVESLFAWLPRPYRLKCVAKNMAAIAFYLKNQWIEVGRGIGEDGEYVLLELPV